MEEEQHRGWVDTKKSSLTRGAVVFRGQDKFPFLFSLFSYLLALNSDTLIGHIWHSRSTRALSGQRTIKKEPQRRVEFPGYCKKDGVQKAILLSDM